MKVINYMNFVRQCEPRYADMKVAEKALFETTVRELEIAKKYDIPCTFLLQYDALLDERYTELLKNNSNKKTELGLWYEIPKQLLDSVGLPWRGQEGWTWDWHVIPGFSMAYTVKEREMLIDSAMEKFREVYGYYPKSVASWLIDTHTVKYLSEKYGVDYVGICRDQTNTDAYTLIGGYFNGAYFPSENNMFTPAQTPDKQIETPVFRLLGPDVVHNYDGRKYVFKEEEGAFLFTLEPAWPTARRKDVVKWYDKTFYENESLNFAYSQIGQENSFFEVGEKMFDALEMQLDIFTKDKNVKFMTTGETGKLFKKSFEQTPACCVYADEDWSNGEDVQSLCYNSKYYTANLFRLKDKIFFRNIYLFDENVKEMYLDTACPTYDATYENLPVSDTLLWKNNNGITLDENAVKFDVEKNDENSVTAFWNGKSVTFNEKSIVLKNVSPVFDLSGATADTAVKNNEILFKKDGISYSVSINGADLIKTGEAVKTTESEKIEIVF